MPSDDHGGESRGDDPKKLWVKFKLWVDTPDGERMWLSEWLDSLPPGTKVRMTDKLKKSNVVPFPGSE